MTSSFAPHYIRLMWPGFLSPKSSILSLACTDPETTIRSDQQKSAKTASHGSIITGKNDLPSELHILSIHTRWGQESKLRLPMSSVLHLRPPFRAEHLGSLKRPHELLEKRTELEQGRITHAELQEVEDKCIGEIVAAQRRIGIKAVTDGEFRRWECSSEIEDEDLLTGVGTCSSMASLTIWSEWSILHQVCAIVAWKHREFNLRRLVHSSSTYVYGIESLHREFWIPDRKYIDVCPGHYGIPGARLQKCCILHLCRTLRRLSKQAHGTENLNL